MKQLSSFMVLSVNGGDRITYTYDEIDDETGEVVNANVKGNFYVTDEDLRGSIGEVRDYIRTNKLAG